MEEQTKIVPGIIQNHRFWQKKSKTVLLFGMMYFVMIRPQRRRQKEHDEMVQELHRGDKVITAGGIYGRVESVSDDSVVLKVESGVTIRVAKSSVGGKQLEPTEQTGKTG